MEQKEKINLNKSIMDPKGKQLKNLNTIIHNGTTQNPGFEDRKEIPLGNSETDPVTKHATETVIANSLFVVKAPLNDTLRRHTRAPVDPRILEKWETIANYPSRPETIRAATRKMTDPNMVCVCVQHPENSSDAMAMTYVSKGFDIQKGNKPPFTGDTVPQYGEALENHLKSSKEDIISLNGKVSKIVTKQKPNPDGS